MVNVLSSYSLQGNVSLSLCIFTDLERLVTFLMKYKDKAVAGCFVFPLCLRVFLVILCRDQVLENVKK